MGDTDGRACRQAGVTRFPHAPAKDPSRALTTARCLATSLKFCVTLALLAVASGAAAELPPDFAPNPVQISPRLSTAGQPSAESLRGLADAGYEAVVYLAPPTVPDAVPDAALIVGSQGLVYVNIPIDFADPTERDVDRFFDVMNALGDRRVLVHCQINMRASVLVFLYRAAVLGEDPALAYAAVERVWVPNGPWRRLISTQLQRHGIAFEPF